MPPNSIYWGFAFVKKHETRTGTILRGDVFPISKAFKPDFILQSPRSLWPLISPMYSVDEEAWVKQLLPFASPDAKALNATTDLAAELINKVRGHDDGIHKIDALLLEYSLDTKEGVLLMCLAEALLRVPDAETADALIEDKLGGADWATHLGKSASFFANVSMSFKPKESSFLSPLIPTPLSLTSKTKVSFCFRNLM